ncbi:MAG: plastocyanin/azurin family copper-binding protein [Candidatus Bipolaricaulia bacterium]
MDLRIVLAVVLVGVLGFVAVHHTQMMDSMGPMGAPPSETERGDHHDTAESAESNVHTVRMVSEDGAYHFEPHVVSVQPGDTVRWVLESGNHSTTSYDPSNGKPLRIPEGAEGWDSGVLSESGTTFEVTFQVEGVYDYFCIPHEGVGMVGTVVVGEAHDGPGLAAPQSELPEAARAKIRELNASAQNPQAEGEAEHHE